MPKSVRTIWKLHLNVDFAEPRALLLHPLASLFLPMTMLRCHFACLQGLLMQSLLIDVFNKSAL